MGEGGAVVTDDAQLTKLVESFRDWGRDCVCPPGEDNTCNKRFSGQFSKLPPGYDHKYVYSHFGYNLKVTDMQAAIGCAQLDKLAEFGTARRENFRFLYDSLTDLQDFFILPETKKNADPSWFGFPLTIRPESGISRDRLVTCLEKEKIQTRMLFSGNLLRHPCFDAVRKIPESFRVIGDLPCTDIVMRHTFWLGVYPGMNEEKLNYMSEHIRNFCRSVPHKMRVLDF